MPINRLAIDTATELCSVALDAGGIVWEDTRRLSRTHNLELLGMVDAIMHKAGVAVAQLDDVIFGAGPGSFTGVRIAASVSQAIAYAASARIVPVATSRALATVTFERCPESRATGVITARRSRRDAYYIAAYTSVQPFGDGVRSDIDDGSDDDSTEQGEPPDHAATVTNLSVSCVLADELLTLAHPAELLASKLGSGWSIVGDGADWLAARLPGAPALGPLDVTALDVLRVAEQAVGHDRPEGGLPIYIAADSPWRKQS